MSIEKISIKHNKHKIHPCQKSKKLSLLKMLIEQNGRSEILVVSTEKSDMLKESIAADNVKITDDTEMAKEAEHKYDLVISFDLPADAEAYVSRVQKASEEAIMLFDNEEQDRLYRIETLLKRAIRQERIEGFGHEAAKKRVKKGPIGKEGDAKKKEHKNNKKASSFRPKAEKEAPQAKKPQRKIAIKELKPKNPEPSNP